MKIEVIENYGINWEILWHKDYYINWKRMWRQFPNNQCVLYYENWKSDWFYPKEYNMKNFKLNKKKW